VGIIRSIRRGIPFYDQQKQWDHSQQGVNTEYVDSLCHKSINGGAAPNLLDGRQKPANLNILNRPCVVLSKLSRDSRIAELTPRFVDTEKLEFANSLFLVSSRGCNGKQSCARRS
jgi:hypothetical protein